MKTWMIKGEKVQEGMWDGKNCAVKNDVQLPPKRQVHELKFSDRSKRLKLDVIMKFKK